ncbi:MAG: LamG domain-containing protein [Planctomycetota bacterium]
MSGDRIIARILCAFSSVLVVCPIAVFGEPAPWWNAGWRFRTAVPNKIPSRDDVVTPTEVVIDFPMLLKRADIAGEFDPGSLRVIEHSGKGPAREMPFACRSEFSAVNGRDEVYLAWFAHRQANQVSVYDIYFDTKDRGIAARNYDADLLPPVNLLSNPGFEDEVEGIPIGWQIAPEALVRLDRFDHTMGRRSLKIVIDGDTAENTPREVTISQMIDVRKFAGQEMVFQCDLLAERAGYGAPVSIELEQFRADGSRILEYAVQPRWLTIELAQGQLVQFCERGRFSPEAARVKAKIRLRCYVRDADARQTLTGPESFFTVWLDRLVIRPGRRLGCPAQSHVGFVEGALKTAPINRGFEFTGIRRLAFNGASEGTLTAGKFNPNPHSVHWGLEAGTLEFWCRPLWNDDDGTEHIFFEGVAYGHRLQSCLRKLGSDGENKLEFTVADAGRRLRTIRGPAALRKDRWHHIAATWDFPKAHLRLFVNGKRIAEQGSGRRPWLSSLVATNDQKSKGIGIAEEDSRSLPMQAFIGGDRTCTPQHAAEAILDEFRISDVSRYNKDFVAAREEFQVDPHTRALFHFENESYGIHDSDDRFVRNHLACELPPQEQTVPLEIFTEGKIDRRLVLVKPHASSELFEANRAENRLPVSRPFRKLPDPRFVDYRLRKVERTITGVDDDFMLKVGGDFEPLMCSVTFQQVQGTSGRTTMLPRWRANDNVVPFSIESLNATLAPDAAGDREKAFETFKYALQTTNYFDAHYCETLADRHRPRVSYTLLKALNIYPFDQCGPLNHMLRKLFLAAGISSNNSSGTHHQFEQAFYQGSWRLFDLSPRVYWLDRDDATVLSRRGLEEDPYLKLRQGGNMSAWLRGRRSRATFGTAEKPHNMDFPLRSGERVSIGWHNEGRWFELTNNREPIPLAKIPPYFGNGTILYEPVAQTESSIFNSLLIEPHGQAPASLRLRDPDEAGVLVYQVACPYILSDAMVAGSYQAHSPGAITISLSFNRGESWTELWRNPNREGKIAVNMCQEIAARYGYWLKIRLAPEQLAEIIGLKVRTTFIVSPLSLPGRLSRGDNRISFVGGPLAVPVKTTCRWIERYRSKLAVSLNSISYYMNDDQAHRNLFIVAPEGETPVEVALSGQDVVGDVSLENMPEGWTSDPVKRSVRLSNPDETTATRFLLQTSEIRTGEIRTFDIMIQEHGRRRMIPAQVLVADAALVREAERADQTMEKVSPVNLPEASGARVMTFNGSGKLDFDIFARYSGTYVLWLRARWEPQSSTHMTLKLDKDKFRDLRATAMIGFTDWNDPERAHTKMFAHYGEQYSHWSWYRIPGIHLTEGEHHLILGADAGACFDVIVLLPQTPAIDRTAMNLFQNWNYAPWHQPDSL